MGGREGGVVVVVVLRLAEGRRTVALSGKRNNKGAPRRHCFCTDGLEGSFLYLDLDYGSGGGGESAAAGPVLSITYLSGPEENLFPQKRVSSSSVQIFVRSDPSPGPATSLLEMSPDYSRVVLVRYRTCPTSVVPLVPFLHFYQVRRLYS